MTVRVKKRSLCSQVSYAFVTMPEGERAVGREVGWAGGRGSGGG